MALTFKQTHEESFQYNIIAISTSGELDDGALEKERAFCQQIRRSEKEYDLERPWGAICKMRQESYLTVDDWPYRAHSVFNPQLR